MIIDLSLFSHIIVQYISDNFSTPRKVEANSGQLGIMICFGLLLVPVYEMIKTLHCLHTAADNNAGLQMLC